jgi:DNA invertase Pin-like site-specific DNA recombinase
MPLRPLPQTLDDLRGLRAAAWVRESTTGQFSRYGPDSQKREIADFIERFGMIDSGILFEVPHSGRTVWRSEAMANMLSRAEQGEFEALLLGYFDRWQRNLRRFLELIEDRLHPAGVVLVMCDQRLVSAHPRDWQRMKDQANRAEDVSLDMGFKIADGLHAKRTQGHHVGPTPRGFTRVDSIDQPDPEALQWVADHIFQPYAETDTSARLIALDNGLRRSNVEQMLKAPYYRPHFPQLWDRAAAKRAERAHGGGPRHRDRFDPLSGRIHCADCHGGIRAYGTGGTNQYPRRYHRCPEPRQQVVWHQRTFLDPLMATLSGLQVSETGLEALSQALQAPPPTSPPDTRPTRDRLGIRLARHEIDWPTFQSEIAKLDAQDAVPSAPRAGITFQKARAYIEDFEGMWKLAPEPERQRMLAATIKSAEFRDSLLTRVELTPDAEQYGISLLLPETIRTPVHSRVALARRTGFEPATFGSGGRRSIH